MNGNFHGYKSRLVVAQVLKAPSLNFWFAQIHRKCQIELLFFFKYMSAPVGLIAYVLFLDLAVKEFEGMCLFHICMTPPENLTCKYLMLCILKHTEVDVLYLLE